ncbi:MAG: filamentous hemagglutinin, partial [Methylovulum sp.]
MDYSDGFIETTKLLAGGKLYDISTADADRHYDSILGVVSDHHPKWGVTESWTIPGLAVKHFETGYSEGKAGGTLNISAYETRLNGTLDGSTIAGTLQRTSDERASGSTLAIDLNNNNLFGKQDVVFNKDAALTDLSFDEALPRKADGSTEAAALMIDAGLFKRSGISNVSIKTNGAVSLQKEADLDLPTDGHLSLSAAGFDIQGAISAPSGDVSLKPVSVNDTLLPSAITLGDSAVIDVAGLWVNDFLDSRQGRALGLIANDGGSVTLTSEQGDLRLEQGSRIDADGGGLLDSGAKITAGQGGSISLTAATHDGGGLSSSLVLNGELSAYGIVEGGSLSLGSSEVVIGAAADAPVRADATTTPLILAPGFFRQGGFADYSVTSNLYGLKVADKVKLEPQQQNLLLSDNVPGQASGSRIEDFSRTVVLPDSTRKAANLSLSFSELLAQNRNEALTIGQGATINTDAGAKVQLN